MTTITTWGPKGFAVDPWIVGWLVSAPEGQRHVMNLNEREPCMGPIKLYGSYGDYICHDPVRLIHIESPSDPPCDTENG